MALTFTTITSDVLASNKLVAISTLGANIGTIPSVVGKFSAPNIVKYATTKALYSGSITGTSGTFSANNIIKASGDLLPYFRVVNITGGTRFVKTLPDLVTAQKSSPNIATLGTNLGIHISYTGQFASIDYAPKGYVKLGSGLVNYSFWS